MAQNYHLIYPIGIILNDGKVLNIIDKNLSYSKNIVDNIKITTKYGIGNNTNVIKSFDNYKFTETKDGKHIYNLIGYGDDVQQLIFDKNDKYLIPLLKNNHIENDEKGNIKIDTTAYLNAVENNAVKTNDDNVINNVENNDENNDDNRSRPNSAISIGSTGSTGSIGSIGSTGSTTAPKTTAPKTTTQRTTTRKTTAQNNNDSRIKELKGLIINYMNYDCNVDNLRPIIKNQCDQLQQLKNELEKLQNKAGKTRKTRKTKKNQKKSRKNRK